MNFVSVTGKNWILKEFNPSDVDRIAESFSLTEITAKLLSIRKKNINNIDLYINPKSYNEIAEFYKIMEKKWNYKSSEIMSSLVKKNSKLWCYLEQNNFVNIINKIQKNKTDKVYVIEQFNRWFDSLKIYKFLKSYDK